MTGFFRKKIDISSAMRIEQRTGFFFILPCFVFLLIFLIYPLFETISLSFQEYNPLSSLTKTFVGVKNYLWLINDSTFSNALYNTIIYTVLSVIFQCILGLIIAIIISSLKDGGSKKMLTSAVLTSIFMIPWSIPGVTVYTVWKLLLHPLFGPINAILGKSIMWLSDSRLALYSIVIVDIWKCTPFFIIMFLAAIIAIPQEQMEAASVDGAGGWQKFRFILLPSIIPVIIVTCIFRAIDSFTKVFDAVFLLTNGGPGSATEMIPTVIFKTALKYFRFGNASAMSVISILISIIVGVWLLKAKTK